MCNPGQVYTVAPGKGGMLGVFRLESQMLPVPQLPQKLRQIVGDKPVVIGEMLRAKFGDLPAGDIAVHPVQESRVCPLGGMEFYDVNFSYIDNETFEEHYVSVPEQGGGKLLICACSGARGRPYIRKRKSLPLAVQRC